MTQVVGAYAKHRLQQKQATYARLRLRELVASTDEYYLGYDESDPDCICGLAQDSADAEDGAWEHWKLWQRLTPLETHELVAELEAHDDSWYRGPGRGFAHAGVVFNIDDHAVLWVQRGGLDI
jgi:hypothetical protein